MHMTDNIIKSWNDRTIRIREDRYVCLTDMAQASGKNINDFLRLNKTKSYLEALSTVTGNPVTAQNQGFQALIEVKKGGNPQDQGTWGHPKVALRFAQWCSDEFAVQVDYWIDELLTTGSVSLSPQIPKKAIHYYTDRVMDLPKKLQCPDGRWTVIEESSFLLIQVEAMGWEVNRFDLLDGSVGIKWGHYREEVGLPQVKKDAPYQMDGRGTFNICSFPYSELGIFKQWLREIYMTTWMPKYLEKKYKALAKQS